MAPTNNSVGSKKQPSYSAVKSAGRMRFNKPELSALAAQPSHKFEKEGVLFVKERQEGFFRRTEISVERWCRLRGNLLFYFKSRDHWSEPAGVIVLEDCEIKIETNPLESTYGIILVFGGGHQQHLATYTGNERDSWTAALRSASHHHMRSHLEALRQRLKAKLCGIGGDNVEASDNTEPCNPPVIDPGEASLLEVCLSCDNLLCDALGRPPSAKLVISVKNPTEYMWTKYAQTEVAEKSSNPVYLRTVTFRSDLPVQTEIRVTAFDLRERFTSTTTLLGSAKVDLETLKAEGRTRLKLESPNPEGRTAGFVSVSACLLEPDLPASTDSTPNHSATPLPNRSGARTAGNNQAKPVRHRRSQSLPPTIHHQFRLPNHHSLNLLFTNPAVKTYRFHSGLGGDIAVQEIMAESKLCFTFPQQLISLWICEEKELVHEIAGLGELKAPWHACQMTWLENHLNLINTYSQGLENLDAYKGPNFRKSSSKSDPTFAFVPTNLHLQRMWAENDSLRKAGFFDVFTHGAFTAFAMKKSPGLIKMLKELKAPQKDSTAWCSQSDRLQMAEDTLTAVRRVRKEVVDCMRILMKCGKEKRREGMFNIVEEMLRKTKCLCSLMDQQVVEEVFSFLEDNRITVRPEKDEFSESVAEFMQRNKLKIDLPLFRPKFDITLQTPCTEFVSKELRTPDVDFFSPIDPTLNGEFWRSYSSYTSGYQSVDRLSDIDEFEESFKYLSVIDKTKHYYTLCRTGSPIDTPVETPEPSPKHKLERTPCRIARTIIEEQLINGVFAAEDHSISKLPSDFDEVGDEGIGGDETIEVEHSMSGELSITISNDTPTEPESTPNRPDDTTVEPDKEDTKNEDDKKDDEAEKQNKADQNMTSDSPAGLHYRAGDEPEPIDLTQLNVEAAMMCLASKVRMLCGKANSPTLSSRTFRFKELDRRTNSKDTFKIPDVPNPRTDEDEIIDWAAELRPSMRKLRQGMDSLIKTSRLVCSVLRLQQLQEAVNLSHAIKHRRDICFCQALTALVTGLMTKFWCQEPDPAFLSICAQLGPIVSFEGLLSLHGEDVAIFNDMIVAVEDLRNVEFTLILVDKKTKVTKIKKASNGQTRAQTSRKGSPDIPILEYHTFPLPRVTGSRSALKVMLPVPDYVYTMLPSMDQMKNMTFSVTPVFFNVGINENATIAAKFGNNGPQEKNNLDNFKTVADYYRRYKHISVPQTASSRGKRNSVYSNEPLIEDLLSILKNEVHNRKNKNVEILHLASNIVRRMTGLRFTSCKSGKDRTGMSATLEQVQILSRDFDLAEHEYQRALDAMRSEGTRRDNTYKNIGQRLFAFNSLQLSTFPNQYRPPVGSYGSKET